MLARFSFVACAVACMSLHAVRADTVDAPAAPVMVPALASAIVVPTRAPARLNASAPTLQESPGEAFFGEPDAPIRAALAHEDIASIERGRGGRSLGFRITLASGQKGYFKPEQSFSAANWFGEVAAYHLDRMLGLGRVPAVVSRVFPWSALEPSAGSDPRKVEVVVRDGNVFGAFVSWINGGLRAMEQQEGWERWLRVEHWSSTQATPFQRAALWQRDMALIRKYGTGWRSEEDRTRLRAAHPEPVRPDRPAELSDLILFDYLTRNLDRWGGNNANVLVRNAGGPLVFLDNGAGFAPGDYKPDLLEARLHVLQRFRRGTVEAIRALDLKRFEERLSHEAITPVLPRTQLNALALRRRLLLEYVEMLEAQHGEAIWAWE
jgi:hypothetical protein